MAFQIQRRIGYTKSWKSTLMIGLILSAVFCFILVFLQPFDTYSTELSNKNIKLIGYSIPILISISLIHYFENLWYKRSSTWTMIDEIVVMMLGTVTITILSFIYLNNLVNPDALPWSEFFSWFKTFGLPFAPLLLLLWTYLRFSFSKIELNKNSINVKKMVKISGTNANENLEIEWSNFLLAQSQSNYIEIFYWDEKKEETNKVIIRSTLSKVLSQVPEATQIHRSYITNLAQIQSLEGNIRKGWCFIKGIEEKVPVSPKHFKALKSEIQNHP